MMETSGPRLRSLLRQAAKLANSGKITAAEMMYRQILQEAPDLAMARVGLAGVLRDSLAAEEAYHKALTIEPDNEAALSGLAHLRGEVSEVEPSQVMSQVSGEGEGEGGTAVAPSETDAFTQTAEPEVVEFFCANHPRRKTGLRCYSCGKPICIQCAKSTPVGYSCYQCIYEAQEVYFSAEPFDYFVTTLVIFPLSLILGAVVAYLVGGYLIWFMFAIGGGVGSFLGYLAYRVAGRRRGRYMPYFVAGLIATGAILPALFTLFTGDIFSLIGVGIYLAVAPAAAFYQLK